MQGLSMPPSGQTEVIDSNNVFDPFPNDPMAMATKRSNSSTATESVSSDNMQPSPESPLRDSNRMLPASPHRSPARSYRAGSPLRSPKVNTNSPVAQGSPSDRGMVHTRTNFGKTRGYVPPMVPSTSPGGRISMDSPPVVPPSPRGNKSSMTPFLEDEEEDAPDDEAQFRTIRSLRPKPGQEGTLRSGRLQRRRPTQEATESVSSPRPDAYISETDESSLGHHDLSFEPRPLPPSPIRPSQDARQPSPEAPFDMVPRRSGSKEPRHPSPLENIQASPIRPCKKEPQEDEVSAPSSPGRLSAEELGELRRRRRRIKNRKLKPPAPESQQFEMPSPTVDPHPPPVPVTSTKTSDLTDDTELDPIPSFDNSVVRRVVESEMEYHEDCDIYTVPPAPAESPMYEEFETGREASVSPQKVKPKSILRTKRTMSQASDENDADDDDDSLFDFGSASGSGGAQTMALGAGTSIRKSSLKSGTNSSNRRGRRPRRRSEEVGNDDDESLIQYGEVRPRSASLQERTQEAWTFRSKRSFSASSPKKESAGVQFENTNTVHHFADDQETVGTGGSVHSFNSLYTKSPESEAEDLIKDLLMIGSGEHSNPGRRKLKYQPEYKRQLKDRADERSVDDNTLGTTDISLNTLDYNTGHRTYTEVVPITEAKKEITPRNNDNLSKSVCETLDSKSTSNDGGDPLAIVWGYVESGMQALGLAEVPSKANQVEEKEKSPKAIEAEPEPAPESNAEEKPDEVELAATATEEDSLVMAKSSSLVATKSSELEGIAASGTEEDFFVDEVKKVDTKGSFVEVMEYIFGDPQSKKAEQEADPSSAVSTTTSSTPLEEDPRLEELALHAVKSKHQMYDLIYDEKFPFDPERDIKFSLVKTKLPLGILFHENDGGCWITKVFPDGNAAKAGGVEVGDQLAAINGISAIKLRVDQICTLITEAPDPDNIELTFLRYTGQLHPFVPDMDETEEIHEESLEVTNEEAAAKATPQKKLSLRALPKLRTRDPSPRRPKSNRTRDSSPRPERSPKFAKAEPKGKKKLGKWFGRGKKKS